MLNKIIRGEGRTMQVLVVSHSITSNQKFKLTSEFITVKLIVAKLSLGPVKLG